MSGFENGSWNQMGGDMVGIGEYDFFGCANSLSNDGLSIAIGASYGTSFDYVNDVRIYRFVENTAGLSDWQLNSSSTIVQDTGSTNGFTNFCLSNNGNIVSVSTNNSFSPSNSSYKDKITSFNIENNTISQINTISLDDHLEPGWRGIIEQSGTIVLVEKMVPASGVGVMPQYLSFIFLSN